MKEIKSSRKNGIHPWGLILCCMPRGSIIHAIYNVILSCFVYTRRTKTQASTNKTHRSMMTGDMYTKFDTSFTFKNIIKILKALCRYEHLKEDVMD